MDDVSMKIRREILDNMDLQQRFGIKRSKASQMIREIKSVSDILGISGRVHERDYQLWMEEREKQQANRRRSD